MSDFTPPADKKPEAITAAHPALAQVTVADWAALMNTVAARQAVNTTQI